MRAEIEPGLTPILPLSNISRARLTRPYAPRPNSPSITYSEILRPPMKLSLSGEGLGGRVETTLVRLDELPNRMSFGDDSGGDKDVGSIWTMDNRPAIRETRCCDDLRRGRGAVGDRDSGGRDPALDAGLEEE